MSSPTGSATSESKRYIIGPMLEFGLPFGLSVEADALYQRQGYRSGFSNFAASSTDRVRASAWEVPVLLKYKLPIPILKPFVEGGVAPRLMSGASDRWEAWSTDFGTGAVTHAQGQSSADWPNSVGAVMGAGVQFGLGSLRLAPELRYTHWNNTPNSASGPFGYSFHSAQNQMDLLVGISWKAR